MMKTKNYLAIAILLFTTGMYSQQNKIVQTIDTILLNFDAIENISMLQTPKQKRTFKEYLLLLRNIELEQRRFKGGISFGLNGLEATENNNYVLNTGVKLTAGTYPFEFKLNSNIQAQTQNGVLKETVSNLNISFDYNYLDENLGRESYVFINRSNNSLLGIDQRYEIGAGAIFNLFSGDHKDKNSYRGLTKKGEKILRNLYKKANQPAIKEETFKLCLDTICKQVKIIKDKDRDELKNSKRRFDKIIRKTESKFRFSVLAGLNYELEKTSDSLKIRNMMMDTVASFKATNRFRMVIRPGIEFKGGNYTFSSKAYFKIGIIGELESVVSQDNLKDTRRDYWAEWSNSLKFNFTEKIGIEVSYSIFYDNAPNRKYFNIATAGTDPDFQLFEAEDTFRALSFKFTYKL